jgi:hypothetical protein
MQFPFLLQEEMMYKLLPCWAFDFSSLYAIAAEYSSTSSTGDCEDIHRVNLPLHAVELRQLPPYQLLE